MGEVFLPQDRYAENLRPITYLGDVLKEIVFLCSFAFDSRLRIPLVDQVGPAKLSLIMTNPSIESVCVKPNGTLRTMA